MIDARGFLSLRRLRHRFGWSTIESDAGVAGTKSSPLLFRASQRQSGKLVIMPDDPTDSPLPLEYATPNAVRLSNRNRWLFLIAGTLVLLLLAITPLLPPSLNGHHATPYSSCASNLHQIGLGIMLYANDNNGQYPDSFQTLAGAEQLMPQVFCCPSSNDEPSSQPTTQAQIEDFAKPGHVSYIYLGKGLTDKTVLPNQVIAYEPLANHGNGIDVLLGDGHAEFVDASRAKKIIAAAGASTQPVVLPP